MPIFWTSEEEGMGVGYKTPPPCCSPPKRYKDSSKADPILSPTRNEAALELEYRPPMCAGAAYALRTLSDK